MKQPLLGQILECLPSNKKIVIKGEHGSTSGSASALYDTIGNVLLNSPVYSIDVTEEGIIIEIGGL